MERGEALQIIEEKREHLEEDFTRQKHRVKALLNNILGMLEFDGYYAIEELSEQLSTATKDYLQSAKALKEL
jgi:hypothetical protein